MLAVPENSAAMAKLVHPRTALAAWSLWIQAAETAVHSALTIQARLALIGTAMLAGKDYPLGEMSQMVLEKQQALMDSAYAVWRANPALATDPRAVLRTSTAALRPYRRKTRSNARRLSR